MTRSSSDLVRSALVDPEAVRGWSLAQTSLLLRQARASGLVGRVARLVDASRLPSIRGTVEAADRVARAQHAEIRRELRHLQQALAPIGVPVLLLKGAAYVAAGLPAAEGRVFSDVDILVPKSRLAEVESALMLAGWISTHDNAYDQRYYREWMHELPPMEHVFRRTVLDVHHTILPGTGRLRPNAARLIGDARALPDWPGVSVLCDTDMVLHSMTHLFMNDDMSHALRDLSDLDLLIRHFAVDPTFWPRLHGRAKLHGLERILCYGLRQTQAVLGTPAPDAAVAAVEAAAPRWPTSMLMDAIWSAVLGSPHPSCAPRLRSAALFALLVRGHWLRMPIGLLVRHLTVKALRLHERETRRSAA